MLTADRSNSLRPASVLGLALLAMFMQPMRTDADGREWLPNAPGRYKPMFFADSEARRIASAAEVRALRAEWQKLDAIMRTAPLMAKPIGFNPQIGGLLDGEYGPLVPVGKGQPLPFHWGLSIYPLLRDPSDKSGISDIGETVQWTFEVNGANYFMLLDRGPSIDSDFFGDIGVPPVRGDDILGLPAYHSGGKTFLILTHSKAPLFAPVTVEEARRAQIRTAEAERDKANESIRELEERMRNAPAERERAIQVAREVARITKRPVDEEIAQSIALFEAELQGDSKRLEWGRRTVAEAEKLIAGIRLGITPADRTAPACEFRGKDSESPFQRIQRLGAPECKPLARLNWKQLFNPALPRTTPQLVVIDGSCWNQSAVDFGGRCTSFKKIMETLDWAALRAWVK